MKKIAVIGYGRFGQLLTELLLKHTQHDVLVVTKKAVTSHKRLTTGTLPDLKGADLVIPTVPISAFADTISAISPHLKPGCICIDVCSVKTYPAEVMLKTLPSSVSIVATHPMFGPDSVAKNKGLSGLKIVVHPVRVDPTQFQGIRNFCQVLGLEVIQLSPEEHDKHVAFSQLYTFCIGSLTRLMELTATPIDTYWFNFFLEQSQVVSKDGEQLFHDLLKYNPYAKDFISKLRESSENLLVAIESELA